MRTDALSEPKLEGRTFELEELHRSLLSAFEGSGKTVFVSGEAGSGKTRLVNEFLDIAKKKNTIVLNGWCLRNAAVPYFPFVEAFKSYSSNVEGEFRATSFQQLAIESRLTEKSQTDDSTSYNSLDPHVWKDQAFASVTKDLLLMSARKPTILFLDDIHWADSASLALLHYITRSISFERILLLATFRTEEVNASIEGQVHPLVETLQLMGRDGIFKDIRLSNLSQPDVGRIAESMLGGIVHSALVETLSKESSGNPLFVVESLRMLYEQESLFQEKGEWRLDAEKFSIPTRVRDVILRRLSLLKPNQRRILDVASVMGEKFNPRLVAAVVNQDTFDVLEALNSIEQTTLLVHCEDKYYEFNHAKYREMLSDQIPSLLKKEYHLRIAQKLETNIPNTKGFPVSDLAYHYCQAEEEEKAVKYALAAGKEALAGFSNVEAIEHFSYVLKKTSKSLLYANERTSALEGLGEALFANSRFKEAMRTFEELGNAETGVVRLRAFRRAMDAAFFQGDSSHLLELTKKAEEYTSADRLESARVLMNKARAVLFANAPISSVDLFEEALNIFEEECSIPDIARVLLALGSTGFREQRLVKGLANVLHAITLFDELGDLHGLMEAYYRTGQTLGCRHLNAEALRLHEKAIQIGEKIGDFNGVAEAYASAAWIFENTRDFPDALPRSLKALEYSKKSDSSWIYGMACSNLTTEYAKLGDTEHAEEYFNKLIKLPSQTFSNWLVKFNLAKANFLAAKNQWIEANHCFEETLSALEGKNPAYQALIKSYEILLRTSYAETLDSQGRVEEAKKQTKEAERIIKKFQKHFQHSKISPTILAPMQVERGKDFTVRLDLINASAKPAKLLRIERLAPKVFKATMVPDYGNMQNDCFVMKTKTIQPFQVEPVKINLRAAEAGVFFLNPQVLYINDLGRTKRCGVRPVKVKVSMKAALSETHQEKVSEVFQPKFELTEAAMKAFDFLIHSFSEDFTRRKFPQERSGWRTLMDIVKKAKVAKHQMYNVSGGRGRAVLELEHRGLVEARFFLGERGRGGRVLKLRVAHENEIVSKYIEKLMNKQ